jgi:hypothetical protein
MSGMPRPPALTRIVLAGAGLTLGLAGLWSALAPTPAVASVKARIVTLQGQVQVALASGWSAGKVSHGKVTITHASPHAVLIVTARTGVKGKVARVEAGNLQAFMKGSGLTNTRVNGNQSGAISDSKVFTEAANSNYGGTLNGTALQGLAVEFENPKTGVAAFAVVIGQASAGKALSTSVMAMIDSIAFIA